MPETEKPVLKKLGVLFQAFKEHQDKGNALVEEIEKILAGAPGTALLLKRLEGSFEDAWQSRYPGRYVWNYKIDRPQMKRLLASLAPEEIEDRMLNYIRSNDAFYAERRHEFRIFASQNNRFASAPATFELSAAAPGDCKHSPRCSSDQEHTRKKSQELRA